MKSRSGFVSNSSASSFVVPYISVDLLGSHDGKVLLSDKEIKLLKKEGFRRCSVTHPSHLDACWPDYGDIEVWPRGKRRKYQPLSYALCVMCNEDDVKRFLLENNISFIASCHYGHQTVVFHKGDNHFVEYQNFGAIVETYHRNHSFDEILKEWSIMHDGFVPFKRHDVAYFLDKELEWAVERAKLEAEEEEEDNED